MTTPTILEWHGCYDDNWNKYIVPEAFAHPAKYARGLITRIFKYMLAEGMLAKGSTVVDPFGGIGTGGVVAAGLGLRWFGCELEPKFHDLGQKNFALHASAWKQLGDPIPILIQGDSRKLRENLRWHLETLRANTPHGADSVNTGSKNQNTNSPDSKSGSGEADGSSSAASGSAQSALRSMNTTAIVSSPPYNLPMSQDHNGSRGGKRGTEPSEHGAFVKYGSTPGQLEGLPMGDVEAVVSSPPYESGGNSNSAKSIASQQSNREAKERFAGWATGRNEWVRSYGNSDGQMGNQAGETFWHAARDIVAECFAILKPGGWSAWVCKDYVRDKARVPFCDDWCKLLESQGFVVTARVHAMLVKETRDADLFGGDDHVRKKERKSFFRRLAEKKGSPPIDFEEVIFARKPCVN
jgi:hypothetical protein